MSSEHGPISVVVTVLDDREGLTQLLPALASQTRPPDEVVVVDGGSTDGTRELLESWKGRLPLRVLVAPEANISGGRNVGIEAAENEWIACTDAGCTPAPGWLAAIDEARDRADLVRGIFRVEGDTTFERTLGLTHHPSPTELRDPAPLIRLSHLFFGRRYHAKRAGGNSLAFTKSAWRAVGGFPEKVHAGEDQAFSVRLAKEGFRVTLVDEAVVRWRPPSSWAGNARMFFTYCRGDVRCEGARWRHAARLGAWTVAPVVLARGRLGGRLAVLAGGLAYIALPIRRAWRTRLPARDWWRIPFLVAMKDLSQIAGAVIGLVDEARGIPQPNPRRSR